MSEVPYSVMEPSLREQVAQAIAADLLGRQDPAVVLVPEEDGADA